MDKWVKQDVYKIWIDDSPSDLSTGGQQGYSRVGSLLLKALFICLILRQYICDIIISNKKLFKIIQSYQDLKLVYWKIDLHPWVSIALS